MSEITDPDSPESDYRLGARRSAVHRGALTYGQTFTITKGLSVGASINALRIAIAEEVAEIADEAFWSTSDIDTERAMRAFREAARDRAALAATEGK